MKVTTIKNNEPAPAITSPEDILYVEGKGGVKNKWVPVKGGWLPEASVVALKTKKINNLRSLEINLRQ